MATGSSKGRCLHYSDRIIVKDRRDVLRREFVCGVTDQKTGLANSTVTDDDASMEIYCQLLFTLLIIASKFFIQMRISEENILDRRTHCCCTLRRVMSARLPVRFAQFRQSCSKLSSRHHSTSLAAYRKRHIPKCERRGQRLMWVG